MCAASMIPDDSSSWVMKAGLFGRLASKNAGCHLEELAGGDLIDSDLRHARVVAGVLVHDDPAEPVDRHVSTLHASLLENGGGEDPCIVGALIAGQDDENVTTVRRNRDDPHNSQ
jgi:hypothetical protein